MVLAYLWPVRRPALWKAGLLLLALGGLWAATAPGVLAQDPAKNPIVFFGDHKFPPYEYLDDGKPAGANVELIKAVGEALGRPVEIRLMAWPEAQKLIGQGEGLAKSLAELHGGNLVIASEVGRGTTVIVQLPKGQA